MEITESCKKSSESERKEILLNLFLSMTYQPHVPSCVRIGEALGIPSDVILQSMINMALEEKRACLWHAFNALDDQRKGMGFKSQLKVLTHNIATCLGIQKAEDGLQDYRSSNSISFRDYLYFLKVQLFDRLNSADEQNANANLDKVDQVCWFVCLKNVLAREHKKLNEEDTYKFWRIYNFLAETDSSSEVICPVVVEQEEVMLLMQKFCAAAGKLFEPSDYEDVLSQLLYLSFEQALMLLEMRGCKGLEADIISSAISELYDEFIANVIKKGYLVKKGHVMTNWKERWFVLTPRIMKYYTTRDENDLKGSVSLTTQCKVETLAERTGSKSNRFQLISEGKTYEISAPDAKTKSEWMTALRNAIDTCQKPCSLQRLAFQKRKAARDARRAKKEEEDEKRRKEEELMEQTRKQLEEEKKARAEAEGKWKEETAAREAEEKRRKELEDLQGQLEHLLEEERQAKRDEEIVRNLQAKILEEEFEKSDQLKKLQEEMAEELAREKEERSKVEDLRSQQEERLKEEQKKLEELEKERLANEEKLKEAFQKLLDAEKSKQELCAKMEQKKCHPFFNLRSLSTDPIPRFVSHRGLGSFVDREFQNKLKNGEVGKIGNENNDKEIASDLKTEKEENLEKNENFESDSGKFEENQDDVKRISTVEEETTEEDVVQR